MKSFMWKARALSILLLKESEMPDTVYRYLQSCKVSSSEFVAVWPDTQVRAELIVKVGAKE